MSSEDSGDDRLAQTARRLERWRRQHGGRGRAIPDELWNEAVEVALAEGVEPTARALRVDVERLARRVGDGRVTTGKEIQLGGGGFVELDARGLCVSGTTTVRLVGSDGERLEIEIEGGPEVDVIGLARTFWSRRGCSS